MLRWRWQFDILRRWRRDVLGQRWRIDTGSDGGAATFSGDGGATAFSFTVERLSSTTGGFRLRNIRMNS
jgi:hypothetical protein